MPSRELLRRVRRIEIQTRRLVQQRFAGGYHSVFKGRGIEFAQIREYVPGDDVRLIDWNATARFGKPFVKLYVEERELTVMLLVDASGSMSFGTTGRLKRQLATEFCATIAFSAITNNDRVGLILFTDRSERIIPAKKGRRHILRLIRELLLFQPAGHGTDLAQAIETAGKLMRRAGTIFVVSDFHASEYRRPLATVGKRHDVIAVTLRDRRELPPDEGTEPTLPDEGVFALEDPETGEVRLVDFRDAGTRRLLVERWRERDRERVRELGRAEVEEIRLVTDEPFEEPLIAFFRRRMRHLRQGV